VSTNPVQQSRTVLARALMATGFGFLVAGIALAIWAGPVFLFISAIGLIDFILAWAFSAGHLGGAGVGIQTIPASDQPDTGPDVIASEASDDPDYNPYARED
jgi:hypothetical protein